MKKELMHKQESQIENFLAKENPNETIEPVLKYVIDSVHDDRFRMLISKPKKLITKGTKASQLAKFNLWKDCGEEIVETKNAFKMIGVQKDQIREGAVFVKLGEKTFEITESVRQEVKDPYIKLLEREFTPYKSKLRGQST